MVPRASGVENVDPKDQYGNIWGLLKNPYIMMLA